MIKIAVLTDVHANLPALQATLAAIRHEGYDLLFHTGDAIAIGPYPAECLDLLLNTRDSHFIMGNHDDWFVQGLPQPQPAWMSDGEVQHQQWTHAQIDPQLRSVVAQWPFQLDQNFEGVSTTFFHYWLDETGRNFGNYIPTPSAVDLDALLTPADTALYFYGHNHAFSDLSGQARYVNPGSLGCHHLPLARYAIVTFERGQFTLEHRQIGYDDSELFLTFEQRRVPDRELLYRIFFGGRFGS